MNSIFLQLLHEDGRTVVHTGNKRQNFCSFLPRNTKEITDFMFIAADW